MKLLITSVDAIVDKATGAPFEGIIESLDYFLESGENNDVVTISISEEKLEPIPDRFNPVQVSRASRGSGSLITSILEKTEYQNHSDIIVLATKLHDMTMAINAKTLLLVASYAESNNPDDRLYSSDYGIGMNTTNSLRKFVDHFTNLTNPWYFKISVDDNFKVYGLTNAQYHNQTEDSVRLSRRLKDFLKQGDGTNATLFKIYSLLATYHIHEEFANIDEWGVYPSSNMEANEELESIKEILRKSYRSSRLTQPILVRTENSRARHQMATDARLNDGCDSQLSTIVLNDRYRGRLEGRNVCIIDDYSNHGSSSETVRHLLQAAGVNSVLFIVLGKFRDTYKKFDYSIEGNVFGNFEFGKNSDGYEEIRGETNPQATVELLESLSDLI